MDASRGSRTRRLPTCPARMKVWAVFSWVLVTASCGPAPPPEEIFADAAYLCEVNSPNDPSPGGPRINVYLDASASMRGFAATGAAGRYVQFLRELRQALVASWGEQQVRYFRFGGAIAPMNALAPALEPQFYDETSSRIDLAVRQANPDALTILITDLCQDQADIASVLGALRGSRVLPDRLSLGVWGLRSRFQGRVYCLQPVVPPFDYRSSESARSFRPFYMLALGRPAHVSSLASQLAGMENVLILGPEPLLRPLRWEPRTVEFEPEGAFVLDPRIAQPSGCGLPFGAFRLWYADRPLTLRAELEVQRAPHGPRILFSRAQPFRLAVLRYHMCGTSAPSGSPAVTALFSDSPDGSASLTLKVDPRSFWGRGTYAIEVRPTAAREAFVLPEWCREWSIGLNEMVACAAAPAAENCNRTPLLFEFLSSVWGMMYDQYRPELGSIYLYFQR